MDLRNNLSNTINYVVLDYSPKYKINVCESILTLLKIFLNEGSTQGDYYNCFILGNNQIVYHKALGT